MSFINFFELIYIFIMVAAGTYLLLYPSIRRIKELKREIEIQKEINSKDKLRYC